MMSAAVAPAPRGRAASSGWKFPASLGLAASLLAGCGSGINLPDGVAVVKTICDDFTGGTQGIAVFRNETDQYQNVEFKIRVSQKGDTLGHTEGQVRLAPGSEFFSGDDRFGQVQRKYDLDNARTECELVEASVE
jgi:hypothetical protein